MYCDYGREGIYYELMKWWCHVHADMLIEAWVVCKVESMSNDVGVYENNVKVWNVMNVDETMFKSQWYEN